MPSNHSETPSEDDTSPYNDCSKQLPSFLRRTRDSKIAKLIVKSDSPPFLRRGRGGKLVGRFI